MYVYFKQNDCFIYTVMLLDMENIRLLTVITLCVVQEGNTLLELHESFRIRMKDQRVHTSL